MMHYAKSFEHLSLLIKKNKLLVIHQSHQSLVTGPTSPKYLRNFSVSNQPLNNSKPKLSSDSLLRRLKGEV